MHEGTWRLGTQIAATDGGDGGRPGSHRPGCYVPDGRGGLTGEGTASPSVTNSRQSRRITAKPSSRLLVFEARDGRSVHIMRWELQHIRCTEPP